MTPVDSFMTCAEVAEHLGMSTRQVERLAAAGDLACVGAVGKALLIDFESVYRLQARGTRRGRAWSPETIHHAIAFLQGNDAHEMSATQRSRLRSRLRTMSAEECVQATFGRARRLRYRATGSFVDRVREQVVLTATSAIDADTAVAATFGIVAASSVEVDGYVSEVNLARLVKRCHLVQDARGNILLRVVSDSNRVGHEVANNVNIALDLSESLDARERSAGLSFLRKQLARVQ
jgi:hypothetical protein